MSEDKIIINKSTRPKKLGMGLSALLGSIDSINNKEEEKPKEGSSLIPLSKIFPNKAQPRKIFTEDELSELSNSIKQNGILQPILVRPLEGEAFEIVAGERRFRAAKLAGLEEIPCTVKEISDSEVFLLAMIENIQRENLNPLEEAEGYLHLINEHGCTQEEIAKIVGKSRSHIANLMRLSKLPQEVKQMVMKNILTNGHVRPLLALKTTEQIREVADVIAQNHYSVRKTEEIVSLILSEEERSEPQNTTKKPQQEANHVNSVLISKITEGFNSMFGSGIKIKPSKNGGTISIKYKTEEGLKNIMKAVLQQD